MTTIDKNAWPRRGHYEFFAPMSHPFYSLTFPVEVTGLRSFCRAHGLSFYPAMVFAVTKAMEQVDAFRVRERDGAIVQYDALVPSFTDLRPDSDLFYIVTLEAGEDLAEFCRRAKAQSAAQTEFLPSGPWDPEQEVYFTCLPWFPLTALTNERNLDPADSIPRVSWGRWEEREGRTLLSLSLELNHRLVDGVHVGRFYEALNRFIQSL